MQATTVTINDLESGEPYFFSVTAYNLDGVESEPSYKVAYIPPITRTTLGPGQTN
jgi:hypothetical protein